MPDSSPLGSSNVSLRTLRDQLTPEAQQLLSMTIDHSNRHRHDLWLVGGAVRDLVMNRPVRDIDITTTGDSLALAEAVQSEWTASEIDIVSHSDLLTASLRTDSNTQLDISRLRTERYTRPGGLPIVSTTKEINLDLQRRDFSINAMAVGLSQDIENTFHDPFNGLSAIETGTLVTLHDNSFVDDPTRLWRAARLLASHELMLDANASHQLHMPEISFENVAGIRLVSELRQISEGPLTLEICSQLHEWGVLERSHPALSFEFSNFRSTKPLTGYNLRTLLTGLLLDATDEMRIAALDRLQLPKQLKLFVQEASGILNNNRAPHFTADNIRYYEKINEESLAIAGTLDSAKTAPFVDAIATWKLCSSHLTASDLREIGITAGPDIGSALHQLKWADFKGIIKSKNDAYYFLRNKDIK